MKPTHRWGCVERCEREATGGKGEGNERATDTIHTGQMEKLARSRASFVCSRYMHMRSLIIHQAFDFALYTHTTAHQSCGNKKQNHIKHPLLHTTIIRTHTDTRTAHGAVLMEVAVVAVAAAALVVALLLMPDYPGYEMAMSSCEHKR